MCDSCLAEAEQYGEVLPGWRLERATKDGHHFKAGTWGLVWCNDPAFVFRATPRREPPACDDESDPYYDEFNDDVLAWTKLAEHSLVCLHDPTSENGVLPFRDYYELVKAGMGEGFDPETSGYFQFWLFDHVGRYIEENPNPLPHLDGFATPEQAR